MNLRPTVWKSLWCAAALLLGSAAQAAPQWTGFFTVTGIYVSSAENYHLRVVGFTPLSICPSGGFAYVNQSASGSKSYIAALMLAHASGKQVNLYVDGDANGYCRIIEFSVGP